ncbi:MAG TPA: UDP-glucose/GDP-mannose dehydrogenase family protein [Anaerolineales bacterium]|nr:UDP-glucose/GDP-mannose dehydrogenase family protein [Anaerolineales bacterium]
MSSISVFGLGYVGAVSLACLADNGHSIVGVDVSPIKVSIINEGRSPIVEEGLNELMCKGVESGAIRATTDSREAIHSTELSIICVGTPSNSNGSLDLRYVERVALEIGEALATKDAYHTVVLRSTVLPGTTEEVVIPALERASGKKCGVDFGVCFNPEFLREGSSIKDFYNPPFTVIGADDEKVAQSVVDLYSMLSAPVRVVPVRVAEMVKYSCNAFHALKVTFANEIGNICKASGIDSHQVMEIFCLDTKLNLSPYYLTPGFAFGGSCLPKDLRALLYHGRHFDLNMPVLASIIPSNNLQVDHAYRMVTEAGSKRVGVLGFSFKAGTDDLRESPIVELIERLIGKGYQVQVYDKNVSLANLHGANRAYIEKEIPHIAQLMMDTVDEVIEGSDVIVIGNNSPEFADVRQRVNGRHVVVDLVRAAGKQAVSSERYQGIGW